MELLTRRAAEQVLARRLQQVNSGNYRRQASCSFSEFVQQTWMPEVLPTVKYSTQKHYQYVIRVHLLPMFASTQLRLISRESVQQFLQAKLRSQLAWKTVRHLRTRVRFASIRCRRIREMRSKKSSICLSDPNGPKLWKSRIPDRR